MLHLSLFLCTCKVVFQLIQKRHISQNSGKSFFAITGHLKYYRESHDMVQYVWTEEGTKLFLSIIRNFDKSLWYKIQNNREINLYIKTSKQLNLNNCFYKSSAICVQKLQILIHVLPRIQIRGKTYGYRERATKWSVFSSIISKVWILEGVI